MRAGLYIVSQTLCRTSPVRTRPLSPVCKTLSGRLTRGVSWHLSVCNDVIKPERDEPFFIWTVIKLWMNRLGNSDLQLLIIIIKKTTIQPNITSSLTRWCWSYNLKRKIQRKTAAHPIHFLWFIQSDSGSPPRLHISNFTTKHKVFTQRLSSRESHIYRRTEQTRISTNIKLLFCCLQVPVGSHTEGEMDALWTRCIGSVFCQPCLCGWCNAPLSSVTSSLCGPFLMPMGPPSPINTSIIGLTIAVVSWH